MEEKKESNLPVVVNDKKLLIPSKYKIYDTFRRGAKIAGGTVGFLGGIVIASAIGGPIAGTLGTGVAVYSFTRAGVNVLNKTEPGLLFVSKKKFLKNESRINQSSRIDLTAKMRGYNQIEKAAMMTLQSLIGLSRYKENLEGSPYYQREDGTKVYTKMFTTVTHSINLKTFKKLEDLGIIEIDPDYPDFKDTGKKSLLIMEKIGFGRYKDISEVAKSLIKRDKESLEKSKKEMKEVRFRLTDKKIDFEDMYKKINGIIPYKSAEEKVALSRMGTIFRTKNGILSTKDLDIEKDITGRTILRYGRRKNNFGKRMERKITEENFLKKEKNEFDKWIKEGITPEMIKTIESGELATKGPSREISKDGEERVE